MTAPVLPDATAPVDDETGDELAVHFPVLVLEGVETSDGRFIDAGALSHRAVPIPVLAQTRNPDGGYGHDGAEVIGRIDFIERVRGSEVVSRETGKPFGDDVWVWRGRGVIDANHEAATLVRNGYLTGNSVDLVDCAVRYEPPTDDEIAEMDPMDLLFGLGGREVMESGVIAATTLVPIPAFADAHVVIGEADFATRARTQLAELALAGERAWPSWRAVEFTLAGGRVNYVRRTPPTRFAAHAGPAVRATGWDTLPVAGDDTAWNAAAAVGRLHERATRADGTLDLDVYGAAFLLRDDAAAEPADAASAFRLPVCTVSDAGELTIVPAAVRDELRTVCSSLHERLGERPPWDADDELAAGDESLNGGDLAAALRTALGMMRELTAASALLATTAETQRELFELQQREREQAALVAQLTK